MVRPPFGGGAAAVSTAGCITSGEFAAGCIGDWKISRGDHAIGWPGLVDIYRIHFQVPDGIAAGMASVQLTAAWVAGPAVNIPISVACRANSELIGIVREPGLCKDRAISCSDVAA